MLQHATKLRLDTAWPALVLVLLGVLALVAGATGGDFTELVANGSAL